MILFQYKEIITNPDRHQYNIKRFIFERIHNYLPVVFYKRLRGANKSSYSWLGRYSKSIHKFKR
jgi:hypothetical protein